MMNCHKLLPVSATIIVLAICTSAQAGGARQAFKVGQAAMAQSNFVAAKTAFDSARKLAPQWAMAHLHWAMAESNIAPENPRVLESLKSATALAPTNPRVLYYLAQALALHSNWAAAAAAYRKVLKRRPDFRDTLFRLATVLKQAKKTDEALESFSTLLNAQPEHLGALVAIAELYEVKGDFKAAESALVTVAQKQPKGAYPRYQLAQFYTRTGQVRKAKTAQKRAEALDPRPKRSMRRLR